MGLLKLADKYTPVSYTHLSKPFSPLPLSFYLLFSHFSSNIFLIRQIGIEPICQISFKNGKGKKRWN